MKTPSSKNYTFKPVNTGEKLIAAIDDNGQPIRGLWRRGDRFYAQLYMPNARGGMSVTKRGLGRFGGVAAAFGALARMKLNIASGQIRPVGKKTVATPAFHSPAGSVTPSPNGTSMNHVETVPAPVAPKSPKAPPLPEGVVPPASKQTFGWLAKLYYDHEIALKNKRPSTLSKEKFLVRSLVKGLGKTPIDHLGPRVLQAYLYKRVGPDGTGPRTANQELAIASNIANFAMKSGVVESNFTRGVEKLKYRRKSFPLVTAEQVEAFCAAALQHLGRGAGERFVALLRFLAFTGARRNEGITAKWADVDFANEQVVFTNTKNGRSRAVDFNEPLKAHLLAMKATRDALPKDERSVWLFPARGNPYCHMGGGGTALMLVKQRSGIDLGGLHNLRRYFASWCVMNKVDFFTIARWLGHSDNGLLLAKTYARISAPHAKAMAATLKVDPALAK